MHLDLVDSLRCTASHESSWLVLTVDRWDDRRIVDGRLGCPICHAQYPIQRGVGDFTGDTPGPAMGIPREPHGDDALRLAAQLDLHEPGGVVIVSGVYGALVDAMAAIAPALYAVLNGPASPVASALGVTDRLPFAPGSVKGLALDDAHASLLAEATRILRPGARLVAPAHAPLPSALREVARDEREWVAALESPASPVVPLRRR